MGNYIGLDISKSNIAVHIPKVSLDIEIDNNIKSIKSLYLKLSKIYKDDLNELVFIYEPTGSYSYMLTKFCSLKGIKAFIINPKQAHNFAKAIGQRSKNDKVDAKMLSSAYAIARDGEIRVPCFDRITDEIKSLIGYYKFITAQRVRDVVTLIEESQINKDK
jgi:transposase